MKFTGLTQILHRPMVLVGALIACLSWQAGIPQAEAATAYATVSVTILPPLSRDSEMHVLPSTLSLGAPHQAITVINSGTAPLRIAVTLSGTAPAEGCNIRYSPMSSEIPPGNSLVVRILDRSTTVGACGSGQYLQIQEEGKPMGQTIEIPLLASAAE